MRPIYSIPGADAPHDTGAHAGSCSATGTPQVEHDGSWIRFHPEASLSNTRSVRPSSCLTSHKVEAYSPMTVQTPSAGVARRMIRTPGRKSEERRWMLKWLTLTRTQM